MEQLFISPFRKLTADKKFNSHIPVIIFSNSEDNRDELDTDRLYANSHIAKPMGYKELKDLIQKLFHYRLRVALIPGS